MESDYDFHPQSGMDYWGRLFWRGENLYRGIGDGRATFYRGLLAKGVVQEMVDKRLLVNSWAAGWSTPEYPLVLQHRVIPTISFAAEWCMLQFQAAALLVLDLEMALRPHNLTLESVSPWNVLFEGAHPYYVDFCSIAPLESPESWPARERFEQYFLNPLALFQLGLSRVARRLLYDPWAGVSSRELRSMSGHPGEFRVTKAKAINAVKLLVKSTTPRRLHPALKAAAKNVRGKSSRADASAEISSLRAKIAALPIVQPKTFWTGYYDTNFPEFVPSERWTSKHHSIFQLLSEIRPRSVLDLGCNRGWYAQLAAHHGARVIAADSDENSLNELYLDAKKSGLAVLPVFQNVLLPEPARGPAYRMFAPASERLKSEMVLALALVHHLVYSNCMNFQQIVETFAMFTEKWLAVEFAGHRDVKVQGCVRALGVSYPWYTLDNFVAALGKRFEIAMKYPCDWGGIPNIGGPEGDMDRVILLGKKRCGS